ncbi:hypothetical protein [Nocardia australiensis]|uniref:hypothetical protein n=1 Tax=Nocardia australiensis TaxID=2887191 RepID=UPI001D15A85A|nr:hypothetical protein [Nocardia australiensis]
MKQHFRKERHGVAERVIGRALTAAVTAPLALATVLTAVAVIPGAGPATANPVAETLYIAESANGRVVSVPAGGGTPSALASGLNHDRPYRVALSGTSLYIAEAGNSTIVAVPTSGGTATPLNIPGLVDPVGIAASGTTLFITESTGRVVSVPTSGGIPTTLASGLSAPQGIAVSDNTLYITGNTANGSVISLPTIGGTPTTIATGLPNPGGIAVSGTTLYVTGSTEVPPGWWTVGYAAFAATVVRDCS